MFKWKHDIKSIAIFSIGLLWLLTNPFEVKAQSDSLFHFQQFIAGSYSYFTTDNLENIYLVNANNQLKKINSKGDSAGVFNDVRKYGKLYSIDVTNPLKILLYYKNFSTIVVLDRFLNMRNTINLRTQNIFKVKAIGTSYDNNIWIFDEGDAKLKKIDDNGQVLAETVDCRMVFDEVPSPQTITDQDGYVYLYDPQKGFYTFDIYGAFKNRSVLINWQNTAVVAKNFYGFSADSLYQYQSPILKLTAFPLSPVFKNAQQIKVSAGKLYVLREEGILIYSLRKAYD
ncbi:MAG: hypothetical protein ACOYKE_04575 [Ferruginibacter sp.]